MDKVRGMRDAGGAGYEAVATEYYDAQAHPTCHNLNRLSRIWLARSLPMATVAATALEVGAGKSALVELYRARGLNIAGLEIQDGSSAMLEHSLGWRESGVVATVALARSTGRAAQSVELLVASLADPYNDEVFWQEARRVVKRGGHIAVTLPSFEWASRFRSAVGDSAQGAAFKLRDGRDLVLPSYVRPLTEQVSMMEQAGFMLIRFDSLGVGDLPIEDPVSQKALLFPHDVSSLVWGFLAVSVERDLSPSFSTAS